MRVVDLTQQMTGEMPPTEGVSRPSCEGPALAEAGGRAALDEIPPDRLATDATHRQPGPSARAEPEPQLHEIRENDAGLLGCAIVALVARHPERVRRFGVASGPAERTEVEQPLPVPAAGMLES